MLLSRFLERRKNLRRKAIFADSEKIVYLLALGDVKIRVQIRGFRRIYNQHEVRFHTAVAEKMGNPEASVT
jgi:hypothetical protein